MNEDFQYLSPQNIYMDAACQSLRPCSVVEALRKYYQEYNSCGERVKYKWGEIVDSKVDETREKVIGLLGLPARKYFVSFTVNTTYGLNLLQNQIKSGLFDAVLTTDIEHNSVFLSTIVFAQRQNIPRIVLERAPDGSIDLKDLSAQMKNFRKILLVANAVSNIDGRRMENIAEVVKIVHKAGGRVIVDASQTMAHSYTLLKGVEADAICFSAHKMYAPSLGVMVVRKDFLDDLEISFIGGGMVDDVRLDDYDMSYLSPNHIHTVFEAGLQPYGEIIALGTAIDWLRQQDEADLADKYSHLFAVLSKLKDVVLINNKPTPVISFYVKNLDSHLLAKSLSSEGIMARSGYFCCHYYLDHVQKYPPLLRLSLGYHTSRADIDKLINTLCKIVE
jgi:cysteine desulfurase/selenocysteine lyase